MKESDIPTTPSEADKPLENEAEEVKFEPGTKMAWMGKKIIWPPKKLSGE